MKRNQLIVFFALLVVYALSAFLTYAFFSEQMAAMMGVPMPDLGVPNVVVGLANAGIILVAYGLLGLAGYWFAIRLALPGIYRQDGDWRAWVWVPLILGVACGVALIFGDLIFAPINGIGSFPHPAFPVSILASLSAGIGEEIAFRGFVFGLWAFILNWAFKRFHRRTAALWTANILAALAFGAGHLGAALAITGTSSIAELGPILLLEIFLLNGIVGIAAGQQYIKSGLVAAAGVHFWTDVVWHVVWGMFS
jgi:hypothetical protein